MKEFEVDYYISKVSICFDTQALCIILLITEEFLL